MEMRIPKKLAGPCGKGVMVPKNQFKRGGLNSNQRKKESIQFTSDIRATWSEFETKSTSHN